MRSTGQTERNAAPGAAGRASDEGNSLLKESRDPGAGLVVPQRRDMLVGKDDLREREPRVALVRRKRASRTTRTQVTDAPESASAAPKGLHHREMRD